MPYSSCHSYSMCVCVCVFVFVFLFLARHSYSMFALFSIFEEHGPPLLKKLKACHQYLFLLDCTIYSDMLGHQKWWAAISKIDQLPGLIDTSLTENQRQCYIQYTLLLERTWLKFFWKPPKHYILSEKLGWSLVTKRTWKTEEWKIRICKMKCYMKLDLKETEMATKPKRIYSLSDANDRIGDM